MTAVLMLAAGSGSRFGDAALPKQFAALHGEPLLVHALRSYRQAGLGSRLVLVAHPGYLVESQAALVAAGLAKDALLTPGGRDRRASVRRGLDAARRTWRLAGDDPILLHNAASPNTDQETISSCLAALDRADIAQASVPELRSLFRVDGTGNPSALSRREVACACDPTAYRMAALERVLDSLQGEGAAGDSTVDAALGLGLRLELVPSNYGNIKVTTRWDLAAVAAAMAADPAAPGGRRSAERSPRPAA